MRRQRGISLIGTILVLALLGFVGVMAAKLMPAYIEYFAVKKMLAALETQGQTRGTVREIRLAYDKMNTIEDVRNVRGDDLEISKEGGEAVVTASWSVRVPLVHNISACVDFVATTAK